jgi:ArsR family transcriptional regulator, arsenate/arsenite/antimonite-responsive transcriptional repressor
LKGLKNVVKSKAEQELEEFDKVFKALAHPSRRNILVVLVARKGRMTAGEIVNRFTHKWPTITRHLRQLEGAGLVSVHKISREQIYTLNKDKMVKVLANWLKWFN